MVRFTLEEIQEREERKKQMIRLYQGGMTYRQIAAEFGISHQRVVQIIGNSKENLFRAVSKKRCVYSGLRKWLNDNKVSVCELTRRLYGNACGENLNRTRGRLKGNVELTKTYIDKLLKITGLTYEEMVGEDNDRNTT